MYEYVKGTVASIESGYVVIDVQGIGYGIEVPLSTSAELPLPESEKTVKLLTHFHVREDIQKLFGFYTSGEREVFRTLIGINKVGPKVALSVLSSLSVEDIAYSVQSGDSTRFKSVSGIGAKTADRLVLELKGKLKIENLDIKEVPSGKREKGSKSSSKRTNRDDAFSAMISLGYNETQVLMALSRVDEVVGEEDVPVEEWIKKALQAI